MGRLAYKCITGSRLYGTNDENSDIDYRCIEFETPNELLGLTNVDTVQTIQNGTDVITYPFRKFCHLLLEGNPNIVEMVFVPYNLVLYEHKYFSYLLKHKDYFISDNIRKKFYGFAISEMKQAEKEMSAGKTDAVLFKHLAHTVRLLHEGIELLNTGKITFPIHSAETIKQIRAGYYSGTDCLELVNSLIAELNSTIGLLPETPRKDKVEKLMVNVLRMTLNEDEE